MSVDRLFAACLRALAAVFFVAAAAAQAASGQQAYEAQLPPDLATAPDLCALLPCKDVFPGAVSFSQRKGQPPFVEAYGAPDASGKPALLG